MIVGQIVFAPSDPDRPNQCRQVPGFTIEHPPEKFVRSEDWNRGYTMRIVDARTVYATGTNASEPQEGLFDLPAPDQPCMDLAHTAPSLLHIPPGKGYRHRCPSCGLVTTIIPSQVML